MPENRPDLFDRLLAKTGFGEPRPTARPRLLGVFESPGRRADSSSIDPLSEDAEYVSPPSAEPADRNRAGGAPVEHRTTYSPPPAVLSPAPGAPPSPARSSRPLDRAEWSEPGRDEPGTGLIEVIERIREPIATPPPSDWPAHRAPGPEPSPPAGPASDRVAPAAPAPAPSERVTRARPAPVDGAGQRPNGVAVNGRDRRVREQVRISIGRIDITAGPPPGSGRGRPTEPSSGKASGTNGRRKPEVGLAEFLASRDSGTNRRGGR